MPFPLQTLLHLCEELLREAPEDLRRPLPRHDQARSYGRRQSSSGEEAGWKGRYH